MGTSDSPDMCHGCKNLDLDAIFNCASYDNTLAGVPVGEIHGLSNACHECPLCKFLTQLKTPLDEVDGGGTFHLRVFSYATKMGLDGPAHSSPRKIPRQQMVLCLVSGPPVEFPGHDFAGGNDLILPVRSPKTSDSNLSLGGRQVNAEGVDNELIGSWLDCCRRKHTASCPIRSTTLSDLKVIDCQNGQVIVIPANSQYFALSYCIGTSNPSVKNQAKQFPDVVADAMLFVTKLGFKYLWVDQYSINQTDPVEMQKGISSMNTIYSEAFAVIVSLGNNQFEGLRGVSSARRTDQPTYSTARNVYVSTMASVSVAARKSKYMTRGWTYQESVLATRLIIFAPQQVHFVCNASTSTESYWHPGRTTSVVDSPFAIRSDPLLPASGNVLTNDGWQFGDRLFTYTQREFTYESDVLNAYNGILAESEHLTYIGTPFVLRISDSRTRWPENPIDTSPSLAFASGLSWSTTYNDDQGADYHWASTPTNTNFFKRPGFPSWSWAACRTYKSAISYKLPCTRAEMLADLEAGNLQDPGNIKIFFEDDHGEQRPVQNVIEQISGSPVLRGDHHFIHVESIIAKISLCRVDTAEDTGLAKLCINLDGQSSPADETCLICALPAKGPISFGELEDGRFLIQFDRPPTTKDRYDETLLDRELEGIVLFQLKPANPEEGDEYCVLLVEERGDHYERLGLVWVTSSHFELLTHSRKRIKLG